MTSKVRQELKKETKELQGAIAKLSSNLVGLVDLGGTLKFDTTLADCVANRKCGRQVSILAIRCNHQVGKIAVL